VSSAYIQGNNELGFIAEAGAPRGLRPATAFLNSDGLLVLPGAAAGLRQDEAFGLALDRTDAAAGMITIGRQSLLLTAARSWDRRKPAHLCVKCRSWKPAIAATGLPADTTFHDLRHTFASTALAEGVPSPRVPAGSGHKSITAAVDLYGHLVPEASGRARDALDNAFRLARMFPRVPLHDSAEPQVRTMGGGRVGL
jgi:integrase